MGAAHSAAKISSILHGNAGSDSNDESTCLSRDCSRENQLWQVPFTLRQSGTTVESLGHVQSDSSSESFPTSQDGARCPLYPVGYRARRNYVRREWELEVSCTDNGQLLFVVTGEGKERYEGATPTAPWALLALHHRHSTVLNGPQAFGFTDPALRRLLRQLHCADPLNLPDTFVPRQPFRLFLTSPASPTQAETPPPLSSARSASAASQSALEGGAHPVRQSECSEVPRAQVSALVTNNSGAPSTSHHLFTAPKRRRVCSGQAATGAPASPTILGKGKEQSYTPAAAANGSVSPGRKAQKAARDRQRRAERKAAQAAANLLLTARAGNQPSHHERRNETPAEKVLT